MKPEDLYPEVKIYLKTLKDKLKEPYKLEIECHEKENTVLISCSSYEVRSGASEIGTYKEIILSFESDKKKIITLGMSELPIPWGYSIDLNLESLENCIRWFNGESFSKVNDDKLTGEIAFALASIL